MLKSRRVRLALVALALAGAGTSCAKKDTEAPPLAGPSGVTVSPLTPSADFVFSPAAPVTNLVVSFDGSASCAVAGCAASSHSITGYTWNFGDGVVTSGRVASHKFATTANYNVALTVTNDAGLASLTNRVVTVGAATPPTASFVTSPAAPQVGQSVVFNGNASAAASDRTLASYAWNFGDGGTASGPAATHTFTSIGTYTVGLVVTDDVGQRATATNAVTVIPAPPAARPTAAFVYSPTAPQTGRTVLFNGTPSTAASGRSIVSYDWNFGDGGTGSGVTATHSYGLPGTYNVVLVVTDDLGQRSATTQGVTVAPNSTGLFPSAVLTFSPSAPGRR